VTEIIETEETIEDRMAILEMSQFKIQSMQMKKDLTDLAIKKLVRTKNYEESGSRWRKKLTEWKQKYGENVNGQRIEIILDILAMVKKNTTVQALTIQGLKRIKDMVGVIRKTL